MSSALMCCFHNEDYALALGQGLDKMEGMGLSLAHVKARSST